MQLTPDDLQRIFLYLCSFLSVAAFVWWVHAVYTQIQAKTALGEERKEAIGSFLFLLLAPTANALGRWLGPKLDRLEAEAAASGHAAFPVALRRKAESMLTGAGRPHGLAPNEFMGLWALSRLLGFGFGMILYAMLLQRWTGAPPIVLIPFFAILAIMPELLGLWTVLGIIAVMLSLAYYVIVSYYWPGTLPALVLPFVLLGYLMPWIWLRDRERARKKAIRKDLPYALDLLTLSVEAGLDFTAALARIVRRRPGRPLSQELGETLRQIQIGVPRAVALRDLNERVHMEEIFSVTSALIQADELGASLGPILRVQADTFRVRRAQAAEKQAMEAPVKLLFPLICFFFPATFIVIFGPIFIRFVIGTE
ncbi:MAG TPA: type II secretion system F family protein [Planctomycetota bacterium]|nr:type II secretion system F family protein [Planctomycetota bacterium]